MSETEPDPRAPLYVTRRGEVWTVTHADGSTEDFSDMREALWAAQRAASKDGRAVVIDG
jgi:hypothetical protein